MLSDLTSLLARTFPQFCDCPYGAVNSDPPLHSVNIQAIIKEEKKEDRRTAMKCLCEVSRPRVESKSEVEPKRDEKNHYALGFTRSDVS